MRRSFVDAKITKRTKGTKGTKGGNDARAFGPPDCARRMARISARVRPIKHSGTAPADPGRTELTDPTHEIIGLAIKIHRTLGPGLLEVVYQECLCRELAHADFVSRRQVPLPVQDLHLNHAYY